MCSRASREPVSQESPHCMPKYHQLLCIQHLPHRVKSTGIQGVAERQFSPASTLTAPWGHPNGELTLTAHVTTLQPPKASDFNLSSSPNPRSTQSLPFGTAKRVFRYAVDLAPQSLTLRAPHTLTSTSLRAPAPNARDHRTTDCSPPHVSWARHHPSPTTSPSSQSHPSP